jgi:hypothetical protein
LIELGLLDRGSLAAVPERMLAAIVESAEAAQRIRAAVSR